MRSQAANRASVSPSPTTTISVGPARKSMGTSADTIFFAAETYEAPGPHDLRDLRDALRPVGERGDRLRPAYPVDFVDAAELGCREDGVADLRPSLFPPEGGVQSTTLFTPASFATPAVISTVLAYEALPPGM